MNPYLSQVNQRRAYAGLLLEELVRAEQGGQNRLLTQALCQSVLFQLQAAYHFYLREVGATYKCRDPEHIEDVEALVEALQSMGKHPAEAHELANLEQQSGSWLHDMLSAYHSLSAAPGEQPSQQSPIAVVQVSSERDPRDLDGETLSTWREGFEELLERHRQHMLEC